jgi:hypothetical protein
MLTLYGDLDSGNVYKVRLLLPIASPRTMGAASMRSQ